MLFFPEKDESRSQPIGAAALRPLKLLRWWLYLTPKTFDCESGLALEPYDKVDPIEKVVADVAAILGSENGSYFSVIT